MNKLSLAQRIAAKQGISLAAVHRTVESFMSTITPALKSGDHVTLSGFGRFDTYQRKARNGRNPLTGAEMIIKGRRVARFVAGTELTLFSGS